MKRLWVIVVTLLMAAVCFGDATTDAVMWNATSGDWMTSSNWAETLGDGGEWAVPGWVVGNPYNTGSSTDQDWNKGYAYINSGTCNVTPSSKPDGRVNYIYMGDASTSATLNVSADLAVQQKFYTGHVAESTITVNQTAGDVAVGNNFIIQEFSGTGVYNLSGGTLTTNGQKTYMANREDSIATFNITGNAAFTDSFGTDDSGGYMFIGYGLGGSAVVNLQDNASFTSTANRVDVGTNGQGTFNQSGGDFSSFRLYIGRQAGAAVDNVYNMSGGAFDVSKAVVLRDYATFNVIGSGATSIRMAKLDVDQAGDGTQTLGISLDGDGSTLMEVYGTDETYSGADLEAVILEINTLAGFDGEVGDVYDVLWSATYITTTDLVISNLSSTDFELGVVSKAYNGTEGLMLQLTVTPEPATMILLAVGSLLVGKRRRHS